MVKLKETKFWSWDAICWVLSFRSIRPKELRKSFPFQFFSFSLYSWLQFRCAQLIPSKQFWRHPYQILIIIKIATTTPTKPSSLDFKSRLPIQFPIPSSRFCNIINKNWFDQQTPRLALNWCYTLVVQITW